MTICEMRIMDPTGDTKIEWDPDNSDEVKAARSTFDALKKKRFMAYAVRDGGKGEVVSSFNPQERQYILAPPLVGG